MTAASWCHIRLYLEAASDLQVKVSGEDVPKPILNFSEAALEERVAANLARCRYKKPTPVQKYAIPIGLARRDLMACAQTGSGKTAAFCFPIISSILSSGAHPQSLPTCAVSAQAPTDAQYFIMRPFTGREAWCIGRKHALKSCHHAGAGARVCSGPSAPAMTGI